MIHSDEVKRTKLLCAGHPHLIVLLDTELSVCLSHIQQRRAARGDTRPLNPKRTALRFKDGAVDLDGAYAAACAMTPHIAAKMQQQQAAAERQRAKEVADRARRVAHTRRAWRQQHLRQGQAQERRKIGARKHR
jgi:hypothetical protein